MTASIRRLLFAVAFSGALCVIAAAVPVSAQARLVDLFGCRSPAVGQPFLTWGDPFLYELAPGGDFETASWALVNGAARVAGSEPFAATGRLGSYSLSLPTGASAQSPPTCVDATYPTLRFFIAGTGSVMVTLVDGAVTLPVGVMPAGGPWAPSSVMISGAALPGILSGGKAHVSLRFTALTGDPQIDDAFIDPWNRG